MPVKIKINWDNENAVSESVRIYRSDSVFTPASLPSLLTEIFGDVYEYEDLTVNEGQSYFYMLSSKLGDIEKFTECFEVVAKSELEFGGYWIIALAHYGDALAVDLNFENTASETWQDNFGKTIEYGAFVRTYGARNSGTKTALISSQYIDKNPLGLLFNLRGANGAYTNQNVACEIYFEDNLGNTLAVLKITTPSNFTQRLEYGTSLGSLLLAPATGYAQLNGDLAISASGLSFTKVGGGIGSFSLAVDLTMLSRIRVSGLRASTYSSGGSGSLVYFSMKCIGKV